MMPESTISSDVLNRRKPVRQTDGMTQHSLTCAARWSLFSPTVWIKAFMVGIQTGDVTEMKTFDEFYDAYKKQMEYCISLLVNADNAIDVAHAERCPLPLPFLYGG